ncbi:hypothetical protein CPB84DRAFT_1784950 [Gymnopilus junonius]|uniref:Uncharacterized protein n=1 Tax=Gymnopilus junonius TaxID=109634 RepID=A0A9P5TKW3_GYMJU|nr:hypothetical protein CPB84DRAFT_1784950 [Gymnopilus junonius]
MTSILDENLTRDLRKIRSLRPTSGKVLISVADKDLVHHHVVVPVPRSYEAAKSVAFDALGHHLSVSPISTRNSLLEEAFFNYALLSSAGDVVWSRLPPGFWTDVIGDGDELRLLIQPPAPLDWTRDGGRLAKFLLLEPEESVAESESVIIPLPRSYEDARRFALTTFYKRYPTRGVNLRIRKHVGGSPKWVTVDSRLERDWLGYFDDIFKTETYAEIGVDGNRLL